MLPKYQEIEEPLLEEIRRRGGSTRPSDRRNGRTVYEALAEHFRLSEHDLRQSTRDGRPLWVTMVQWARRALVDKKKLDNSQRGVWRLASK